jgi:site-specific recombinase
VLRCAAQLSSRIAQQVLPGTPDTTDFAALFPLLFQPEAMVQATLLRALLDRCLSAAATVTTHLEAYGVSVDIVYELDQLRWRVRRIEQLLALALSPQPARESREVLLGLLKAMDERRGIRRLMARHYSLLARLVAERHAETGAHYITRDGAEYRDMLKRAFGGGLVIAGTTFAKFLILALVLLVQWLAITLFGAPLVGESRPSTCCTR